MEIENIFWHPLKIRQNQTPNPLADITVKGKVVGEDGFTLPGANIYVKGTSISNRPALTGFEIKVPNTCPTSDFHSGYD
jgi:hypothetical protein